jgi:hypothetical protein
MAENETQFEERTKESKSSFGPLILGAVICIGFPAFWTAVAPVSYIHLERGAEGIRATAKTCLLFWIPYSTRQIDIVEKADTRVHAGEWTNDRLRSRSGSRTKSEDEGFIVLMDKDEKVEVPCSPVELESKQKAIDEFIKAEGGPQELNLFCVSNWKFAIFAGGLTSMLTVLYLLGVVIMIGRWISRFVGIRVKQEPI